jgi:hypothetical protein
MKGEMRIGKNHTAGRNPAKLQESKADLTPSSLNFDRICQKCMIQFTSDFLLSPCNWRSFLAKILD